MNNPLKIHEKVPVSLIETIKKAFWRLLQRKRQKAFNLKSNGTCGRFRFPWLAAGASAYADFAPSVGV
ncbi:hypothetical protein [Pseudobacillus wudalianchiensis]|uniref:hypothetical protein n=1 Tax=Pseudobacillus wudalianchiensis TaxID=1743143 RepID=UPI00114765F7|nr:hypothetical protein [Bacillus wudalianchiensis]